MNQWDRLNNLDDDYKQKLQILYDTDGLPMEVRHYLSSWIETQEWDRAARDHALAMALFQVLLQNLDAQHGRFVLEESFLLQHKIRRHKQNFQWYMNDPCALAQKVLWFLQKEQEILDEAGIAEKVQNLQVEPTAMETCTQLELDRKISVLQTDVQCMAHTIICLEEQQDEFDFKYQTYNMESFTDEASKLRRDTVLQGLLNRLNKCRHSTLSDIKKLLDRTEELVELLVKTELVDWQRRQQKSCIGSPDDVCLDLLEKWFTSVAGSLFHLRDFLTKLDELSGKVSYEEDPVKARKPQLFSRTERLLKYLLQSSFVVETQPSMPQAKGPLVIRTNIQFYVKTRLLIKFPEMNNPMEVHVSMDRYRRFNILGIATKTLTMVEGQNGAMVADFRHLNLKEQKCGGPGRGVNDICLSVTEELHILYFHTTFEMKGLSVHLKASSLPVVIISNSSQQQSAWASILWFNMLSQNPKDIKFFTNTPAAPWPQFGEMLSWQFLSATKRGLLDTQLEMIACKLFGTNQQNNYDAFTVPWSKFCKDMSPDTFWVWFDGILMMVKTFLVDLWRDGLIMGFVSKFKEKSLLMTKQRGTFLLRFSESVIGGITFSWVENTKSGTPEVKTVEPFTKADLSQIPFQEIIRNFQILLDDEFPENPLLYLYPNIPKDEAFGKYYSDKMGGKATTYCMYKAVFILAAIFHLVLVIVFFLTKKQLSFNQNLVISTISVIL
uniref:Signal transducer and activator of transcription n=1 Tax=Gouania willdenowi TaxID=441366 RepID=A0A8C5ENX0_GOUWI